MTPKFGFTDNLEAVLHADTGRPGVGIVNSSMVNS